MDSQANGLSNGHANLNGISDNGTTRHGDINDMEVQDGYDLVLVGFGPAALSIAIALHDSRETDTRNLTPPPKVCFVERQNQFAWHSGMLLERAKMQISFIKDLATLRNPRSNFTFINYLHQKGRLIQFTNMGTFLPTRVEFNDYLKWCAYFFEDDVSYGEEVNDITPCYSHEGIITDFQVQSRNTTTNKILYRRTRHVVLAVGGIPHTPYLFFKEHPRIIHSSTYLHQIGTLLPNTAEPHSLAVVGSGQSAVEIFNSLQSQYPASNVHLIFRDSSLKPSDDSPFVNEIFDPARISNFYDIDDKLRRRINHENRGTNYGVVRGELLEHVYESMYLQQVQRGNDEESWQHRIFPECTISTVKHEDNNIQLSFTSRNAVLDLVSRQFNYDVIVLATGYDHTGHLKLLKSMVNHINPDWKAGKDYKLSIPGLKISSDAGIWLQGCNEDTHGVSITITLCMISWLIVPSSRIRF